jgi:hypothetical protein
LRHVYQETFRKEAVVAMRRIAVTAMIVTVALVYTGRSDADAGFSKRSLGGVYGFSGSGSLFAGAVPAAVAGLNSFDRAGGCGITAQFNNGGTVVPLTTAECSYDVFPDGSGFLKVRFNEFPSRFTSNFVLVDNAREIQFVLSDDLFQTVASGVSRKQRGSND